MKAKGKPVSLCPADYRGGILSGPRVPRWYPQMQSQRRISRPAQMGLKAQRSEAK